MIGGGSGGLAAAKAAGDLGAKARRHGLSVGVSACLLKDLFSWISDFRFCGGGGDKGRRGGEKEVWE